MAYIITNPQVGHAVGIAQTDSGFTPPNASSAVPTPPLYPGMVVTAEDPTYGVGEFILLLGTASTAAGDWVSFQSGSYATTRWAGTANEGRPLAVAMAATGANTWGWYQIAGNAVANISGTVAANDKVYWQSTATTSSTQVNGKQVLGAIAAGANGVPAAGKAVITIDRPHSQGQIA
ncbi:MAG TPA: hypothetical protein VN667_05635 [Burkholderiales bacterium]|nr:hypothetical protein [Burkholderiales bacterium]